MSTTPVPPRDGRSLGPDGHGPDGRKGERDPWTDARCRQILSLSRKKGCPRVCTRNVATTHTPTEDHRGHGTVQTPDPPGTGVSGQVSQTDSTPHAHSVPPDGHGVKVDGAGVGAGGTADDRPESGQVVQEVLRTQKTLTTPSTRGHTYTHTLPRVLRAEQRHDTPVYFQPDKNERDTKRNRKKIREE